MEEDARTVEVTQVHLGQHLLWNATVHRDGESLRRVVIERDLLPQCETQSIRQDWKHLVGRMVVDPDEVGMDSGRAREHRSDLGN